MDVFVRRFALPAGSAGQNAYVSPLEVSRPSLPRPGFVVSTSVAWEQSVCRATGWGVEERPASRSGDFRQYFHIIAVPQGALAAQVVTAP